MEDEFYLDEFEEIEHKEEYLCFVKSIGENIEGLNNYELIFTKEPDTFWGENFEYMPCCLCNELNPDEEQYSTVKTIKTKLKLSIITDSCCHSMQDTMDGIVALAYEDISEYEEYPSDGRLVLPYGISYEETERKLAEKNIVLN